MSEELIIRCCAPTLASIKTGNMFTCPYTDKEELLNETIQAVSNQLDKLVADAIEKTDGACPQ